MRGSTYVLDLGANVDCEAEHLLQFAIMGRRWSRRGAQGQRASPAQHREEDIKGNDVVKRAAELLRESELNFIGNIEGDGIYKGEADVVVCDGFRRQRHAQGVRGNGADGAQLHSPGIHAQRFSPGWPA